MEGVGGISMVSLGSGVTKKRARSTRRPRTQPALFSEYPENRSLSSTPSDNVSKGSSEDNNDIDANSRKKERTLNQCISIAPRMRTPGTITEAYFAPVNDAHPSRKVNDISSSGQSGVVSSDGLDNEKKVRKVKFKLGGMTQTLHEKSQNDGAFTDKSSLKSMIQVTSDFCDSSATSQRIQEIIDVASEDTFDGVRKSKRAPKRRIIDASYEDGGDLKFSRASSDSGFDYEDGVKERRKHKRGNSRVPKRDTDHHSNIDARLGIDINTSRSDKSSDDIDYVDEEDMVSDEDLRASKRKNARKTVDVTSESRSELAVTTRRRALQTGKDVSTSGGSLLEYPNGLPPFPPRKQKEKLSELEQQLKRAEALQKRRMQVEKANKELEAEAIRKILGQDSSRKKRENQIKKRHEELAQEKAANALQLAPDIVRWTSGLNGMFVTFPYEMGLPSIFKQEKTSYPPPREKCAGPSCPNTYKYRCSKTKLPLCSLRCYKAIRMPEQPSNACQ